MKRRSLILSGAAIAAWPFKALQAQEAFPAKPIRIIVPYPAGGVVDVQTRAMAQGMEFGQPVVIEARPGANANIAAEAVATAPPFDADWTSRFRLSTIACGALSSSDTVMSKAMRASGAADSKAFIDGIASAAWTLRLI